MGTERERVMRFGRLGDDSQRAGDWRTWGPYLSEREWGTIREDYSEDGDPWRYLPFDDARSRAYRWGEDGLAGFCDLEQRLCLGLALWNGRDPFLKERLFGLSGADGNHGEDVKEHWWYLDAVPSHAWNRWRYHYPQAAFPYEQLRTENGRRDTRSPAYGILDTGIFDQDRYWVTEVTYAKSDDATELLMTVKITNAGPDADTVHVLPTVWFRNTWSWDRDSRKPVIEAAGLTSARIEHPLLGPLELVAGNTPDGTAPTLLFCENETNVSRLFGTATATPYPKDGINDHVTRSAATVNPDRRGTKCAFWYRVEVPSGGSAELRLRLRPRDSAPEPAVALAADFDRLIAARRDEADDFYRELTPPAASADEAMVMRQGFAALLWSKQFYYYDLARWLDGDPGMPPPPPYRFRGEDDGEWRNFSASDVLSVPDKWQHPSFDNWDLAFTSVAISRLDPALAKHQMSLLYSQRYMSLRGQAPAAGEQLEGRVAPVHAWAILEIFAVDHFRDWEWLTATFNKLILNYAWWSSRTDPDGRYVFDGSFAGLNEVWPIDHAVTKWPPIIDRSHLGVEGSGKVTQVDGIAWLAVHCLGMLSIARLLAERDRGYEDIARKFAEDFFRLASDLENQSLWDDQDGWYYDAFDDLTGEPRRVRAHSVTGLIPVLASAGAPATSGLEPTLLSMLDSGRLTRVLARALHPTEFLSAFGIRSLSLYHREHPFIFTRSGRNYETRYEPGQVGWNGPVWIPVNYLIIGALGRLGQYYGDKIELETPTAPGGRHHFTDAARDLAGRLIAPFLTDPDGRRPILGTQPLFQQNRACSDLLSFHECVDPETGAGLGSAHATSAAGLIANLIAMRSGGPEGPR